jgi:uncharacterized protein YjiS (DUF1127 family)
MADPVRRQIDWGSADVQGGSLTVALTGRSSKAWRTRFEAVHALLEHSERDWGEVGLTREAIEVEAVREGSEEALRHFLESLVLQVNAELEPDDVGEDALTGADPQMASDRRMAATFRGFAPA